MTASTQHFVSPSAPGRDTAPRAIFLGMPCAGSVAAARAFAAAGGRLAGVVLAGAGTAGGRPVWPGPEDTGPVLAIDRLDDDAVGKVAILKPDVLIAACFPWRLPAAWLQLAPLGALNVHPALLPRGRGPAPVFWTFKRDERATGVTLHRMDAGFDTGPILGQAPLLFPADGRADTLELALMAAGGALAAALLPAWAAGTLPATPQSDALATRAPIPAAADLTIATAASAASVLRFVRGVGRSHGPVTVVNLATGASWRVVDALDFAHAPPGEVAGAVPEGAVRLWCADGWVLGVLAERGRYPVALSPRSARAKR